MRQRIIPFSWRNVLLGLSGKSREIAEAEYYYEGYELARKLAEIDSENETERKTKVAAVDLKFGKIDEYTYERTVAEANADNVEIAYLDIDLAFNKISEKEHGRKMAELKNERWVYAVLIPETKDGVLSGKFELDWNDLWIDYLAEHGYHAQTEEEIIEMWLKDLQQSYLEEYMNDPDEYLKQMDQEMKVISKTDMSNGRVKYE